VRGAVTRKEAAQVVDAERRDGEEVEEVEVAGARGSRGSGSSSRAARLRGKRRSSGFLLLLPFSFSSGCG
jgi:hypothetical protein